MKPLTGNAIRLKLKTCSVLTTIITAYNYLHGRGSINLPISAPMLQIVAMPVQEMESTPGPKYSTIAPVPPLTVRIPATLSMISLGEVQPLSSPVSFTPITCNWIRQMFKAQRNFAQTITFII